MKNYNWGMLSFRTNFHINDPFHLSGTCTLEEKEAESWFYDGK